MNRGDIHTARLPEGLRPVVVVSRSTLLPLVANLTVASITRTTRGLRSELPVGPRHGLRADSVVDCGDLHTLRRSKLGDRIGALDVIDLELLDAALRFALDLDAP